MAVFVSDTFTEASDVTLASHVGETGATWTLSSALNSGYLAIDSTDGSCRVGFSSTGGCYYYASGVPSSPEYDVEITHKYLTGQPSYFGIVGRGATGAQTFYMGRYNAPSGLWELFKAVSGTFTAIGTYSETLGAGTTRTVKLEIRDIAKKLFVGGIQRITSADNSITAAGRVGLRQNQVSPGGSSIGDHFLDFVATDISGGALYNKLLTGLFPAPSANISTAARFIAAVAGSLPAQSGGVSKVTKKSFSGALPEPSAAIGKITRKNVASTVPSPAGSIAKTLRRVVAGIMPDPSGGLDSAASIKQSVAGIFGTIAGAASGVFKAAGVSTGKAVRLLGSAFKRFLQG